MTEEIVKTEVKIEEPPPKVDFLCCICHMKELVDYKGKKPPFSRHLKLEEESYVMKDPFSPPGKGQVIVMGSDCSICGRTVCIAKECSVFYTKTFCKDCFHDNHEYFPKQIVNKLKGTLL